MFDNIYSTLSAQMSNISAAHTEIAAMVENPLQIGMAINLMICGFAIMRGIVNEPWGAYLSTWVKAELAILAATSNFGPWIGTVAFNLPDRLASAFGAGPFSGQFDQYVSKVSEAAFTMAKSAPLWDFGLGQMPDPVALLLAIFVTLLAYMSAAIGLVMALFTKFSLAVIIAVGPIFVAGLMFNASSGMFFTWLGAALGAAISSASIAAVFAFVSNTVWSFNITGSGTDAYQIYVALIESGLMAFVGGYLLLQAPSIASIGGSGGANGSSLVGSMIPSATMRQVGNWGRSKAAGMMVGTGRSTLRSIPQMYSGPRGQASGNSAPVRSGATRIRGASSSTKKA